MYLLFKRLLTRLLSENESHLVTLNCLQQITELDYQVFPGANWTIRTAEGIKALWNNIQTKSAFKKEDSFLLAWAYFLTSKKEYNTKSVIQKVVSCWLGPIFMGSCTKLGEFESNSESSKICNGVFKGSFLHGYSYIPVWTNNHWRL